MLEPPALRSAPGRGSFAQLAFLGTPHCLLSGLQLLLCVGHAHQLTPLLPSGLALLGCPPCVCVPATGLTEPLSLSRGCFCHHMGLALDELQGKQGRPTLPILHPWELGGVLLRLHGPPGGYWAPGQPPSSAGYSPGPDPL